MEENRGPSLNSLSNYYSGWFGPVGVAADSPPQVFETLAQALKTLACSSVVRLQPLDPDAHWHRSLAIGMRRLGYITSTFFCFANWYQPVLGRRFADYWAERPAALMEHAMDIDQVSEVDYLAGDEPYKADWMSHRRERIGLIAFDPFRWSGLVAAALHFAGQWRRRLHPGKNPLRAAQTAVATDRPRT